MRKQKLVQLIVSGALVLGVISFIPKSWADDTAELKDQVKALQNRVDQLEAQLANRQQVVAPTVFPVNEQWEDPLTQIMRMRQQMDGNMRQAFVDTGVFNPKMDMKHTDHEYIITMDLPGMDRDKINIEIQNGVLNISGERNSETQNNNGNQYYLQERTMGSFMQSIPLPDDAQADQISAKYKNGVLTITVARVKKDEKRPETKKIMVN